jgi:DNA repair exonuclease SbcCD ATPase subunit
MNTDNGALEFDAYFNNEKLNQTAAEAEKKVKQFTNTAVESGEKIDDAFKVTAENIKIQKNVIQQIETQLAQLNLEIAKLPNGSKGQVELKNQAKVLTAELNAEKVALKQLEQQVQQTEQKHISFRTQIRNAREELTQMEQAGLRGTDAYQKLQAKLGQLVDAYGDVQQQAKVMANDEKVFQGIISTVGGITGAFSAAQGAVGLFAGENENLQKIMLKVQSLMAITIGLQQVAEMLNKDSYFSIVVLTKAKEMFAAAELKLAAAFGVSTVAAQILMATLTLGLSVAITAIVVGLSKLSSKSAEARKEMQAFNSAAADAAFKPVAAIQQLSAEWSALGDNLKAKEKFIEDNADKFEELGVSVNGVNDAENLLINNKDKFIESLVLRAKAMAAMEMASEKYKESLKKQLEAEQEPGVRVLSTGIGGSFSPVVIKTNKKSKLEKEKQDLDKEAADLMKRSVEFTEQEKAVLKGIGVSSNQIVEGSITALEESISKLKNKYKNATSDAERSKLESQIKDQEKLLERLDKLGQKDNSKAEAEKAKKAMEDFNDSKLEMQRKYNDAELELMRSQTKDKKALIDIDLKQELAAIDELEKAFLEKAAKAGVTNPDTSVFNSMRSVATLKAGNQKADVDNDKAKADKEEYDRMLKEYGAFEQKKQAIIDEYDEKRKKANGNQDLLKGLDEAQAKSLSKLATDDLTGSDAWTNLFNNLDDMAARDIDTLIQEIEARFSELSVKFDPIDLAAIREKLEQAKAILIADNPFKQIGVSIKAIFNEGAGSSKKSTSEIKKDWKNLSKATEGAFDFVTDAIDSAAFLKDAIGLVGATAISSLQTVAMMSIAVATAIKTAEKSSVILVIIQAVLMVIQAVINVIKALVASHDKKLEDSINKHKANVENLKEAYEDLDRAIEKALSGAEYNLQKDQIGNLKKQRQEYAAMIQAEKDKKKTDNGKIEEYQQGIKEAGIQIEEVINTMKENILQSTVQEAAQGLGDAMIDAFAAGENAAVAWGKKVDDIVGNVVRKMLIQKMVEEPVGNIINKYLNKWVDGNGNFIGFDAVMGSAQDMGKELSALGPGLSAAMASLPDDIKKYLFGSADNSSTMSGAIQGASEQSIDLLSGQANAIRINQIESINIMRSQLIYLMEIAVNTRYNKYLKSIDDRLSTMSADSMRSQGLG